MLSIVGRAGRPGQGQRAANVPLCSGSLPAGIPCAARILDEKTDERFAGFTEGCDAFMATTPEQEEIEIWWGGYSPRAMLPAVLYSLLGTVAIILTAWDVSERHWLPVRLPRYVAEALILLLWVVQLVRWLYRVTARNYRLTTRRLFLLAQFRMPCVGIPLEAIREVRVTRTSFDRFLRLGRLHLRLNDRDKAVVIDGVEQPDRLAELLRQQIGRARAEVGEKATRRVEGKEC